MSSPTQHALLSPSSSDRWLKCTPSAVLEQYEPTTYSPYAEEGTEAHALAEIKLSYMLGKISVEKYETEFENFKLTSKFYNAEFNEYVNKYCNEVMTIIKEDYKDEKVQVELESKVEFSDIVENGSGTSDVLIIGRNFVHVVDLKYGKGVPVSAIGNSQLRLYALGAIRKHMRDGIFTEARMTIIQPRLDDASTDYVAVQTLNDWAQNYVKPRAAMAIAGQGEFVAGDHCKFCKLKGKCQARSDKQLEVAKAEFDAVVVDDQILEPKNMTPEALSRIMTIAPKFIAWFNDVQSYVKSQMIHNNLKIPGFKVVEGRSTRIMTDPDAIVTKLHEAGFTEEECLERPKILGITALEKNVGKKLFNQLCGDYIIKPSGAPTVVPESDSREAIDTNRLKLNGDEFAEQIDYID